MLLIKLWAFANLAKPSTQLNSTLHDSISLSLSGAVCYYLMFRFNFVLILGKVESMLCIDLYACAAFLERCFRRRCGFNEEKIDSRQQWNSLFFWTNNYWSVIKRLKLFRWRLQQQRLRYFAIRGNRKPLRSAGMQLGKGEASDHPTVVESGWQLFINFLLVTVWQLKKTVEKCRIMKKERDELGKMWGKEQNNNRG